jgi:8-oxo-dGTP pyrophosphatase MutT (NUDIX family)
LFESWRIRIEEALQVPLDYDHRKLQPAFADVGSQAAAVLLLLKPMGTEDAEILLTRRTEKVDHHKGQIAFPGGRTDPEDQDSQFVHLTARTTALRETEEEVGIPRSRIEVVGELPPLLTVTRFTVIPVVGLLRDPAEPLAMEPNDHEIDEIFWARISFLRNPGVYRLEQTEFGGRSYPTHVYQVGQHRVWGATGAMLHNFLQRLR